MMQGREKEPTVEQKLKKLLPTRKMVLKTITDAFKEESRYYTFSIDVYEPELEYERSDDSAMFKCKVAILYNDNVNPRVFLFRIKLSQTEELTRASDLYDLWDGGNRISKMIVGDLREQLCWMSREEIVIKRLCGEV
jgi:hypothetical protein